MDCEHLNFAASVNVNRITDDQDDLLAGFCADIRITCADCGQPMLFRCSRNGVHPDEPAVSLDREELNVPIEPDGFVPLRRYPGFSSRLTTRESADA